MRLPTTAHTSRPWRIHDLAPDFRVEDVWALPTPGGPEDFPRLVELLRTWDLARSASPVVRALFAVRFAVGGALGWDRPGGDDGDGEGPPTLRDRLPADLRDDGPAPRAGAISFTSLYETDDEWAAELANRTVHGVLHVSWVEAPGGGHRGQLAILVKPNGRLGRAYMLAIAPARHLLVYPEAMRELGRAWQAGA